MKKKLNKIIFNKMTNEFSGFFSTITLLFMVLLIISLFNNDMERYSYCVGGLVATLWIRFYFFYKLRKWLF